MLDLITLGSQIVERRKTLKLSRAALASKAGVSRATLEALENGRAGEVGFSKVTKLLAVLGLELTLRMETSHRPTLDELLQEDRGDQSRIELTPGETLVLWNHNEPVVEIRLLRGKAARKPRIGVAKGEFMVPDSFFEPLPDEILDAFNGK